MEHTKRVERFLKSKDAYKSLLALAEDDDELGFFLCDDSAVALAMSLQEITDANAVSDKLLEYANSFPLAMVQVVRHIKDGNSALYVVAKHVFASSTVNVSDKAIADAKKAARCLFESLKEYGALKPMRASEYLDMLGSFIGEAEDEPDRHEIRGKFERAMSKLSLKHNFVLGENSLHGVYSAMSFIGNRRCGLISADFVSKFLNITREPQLICVSLSKTSGVSHLQPPPNLHEFAFRETLPIRLVPQIAHHDKKLYAVPHAQKQGENEDGVWMSLAHVVSAKSVESFGSVDESIRDLWLMMGFRVCLNGGFTFPALVRSLPLEIERDYVNRSNRFRWVSGSFAAAAIV